MSIAEKLTQIAENEPKIYEAGKAEGIEQGKAEGIEEGYQEGYNDGNILYYALALNTTFGWAKFPENYNMVLRIKKLTSMGAAFRNAINLKSIKIITEDKETSLSLNQVLRENSSTETLDLTECSRRISNIEYAFYQATALKYIYGAFDLSGVTTTANYDFFANTLEEVEFVPNTIFKSIRFTSTKLTQASVNSIVNGLADLTGQTSQKIQLPSNILLMLSVEQLESITAKNWTT
jgi:hypothetical protein